MQEVSRRVKQKSIALREVRAKIPRMEKLTFENPPKKTGFIQVRMEADLKEWLDSYAEDIGIKPSRIVRRLIENYRDGQKTAKKGRK